jgi:hypothetical protein
MIQAALSAAAAWTARKPDRMPGALALRRGRSGLGGKLKRWPL